MPGTPGRSGGHNKRTSSRRSLAQRRGLAQVAAAPCARPERPAWLTDPIAIEAWDRLCGLLADRAALTVADGDAITLAAVAEAEYRTADALIAAQGLVVNGSPHPATKSRESAWKRWSAGLSRLGLDPITRHRVEPVPPPLPDASARYFA